MRFTNKVQRILKSRFSTQHQNYTISVFLPANLLTYANGRPNLTLFKIFHCPPGRLTLHFACRILVGLKLGPKDNLICSFGCFCLHFMTYSTLQEVYCLFPHIKPPIVSAEWGRVYTKCPFALHATLIPYNPPLVMVSCLTRLLETVIL